MLKSSASTLDSDIDISTEVDEIRYDDSIHQWYRIIMGFDWKLVQFVIEHLEIGPQHLVLDPFCGAGTTLVQCKKSGISSIGIDANPVCTLASRVKTFWRLNPERLTEIHDRISRAVSSSKSGYETSALDYLISSGMIERGWLSLHKAKKVISIRSAIAATSMTNSERRFFSLALASALVQRIADIKFGPEVYCLSQPKRSHVQSSFSGVVTTMIDDLSAIRKASFVDTPSAITLGDSRIPGTFKSVAPKGVDFVITSPPYPAEHDYTRSTRLELVMLDFVQGTSDLRTLKQRMVRCHTKGMYKGDDDAQFAARYPSVQIIAKKLERRAKKRTDGFSRLYGPMVRAYFGGMIRHLRNTLEVVRPGGRCAYVVRDQQSLLGVYVDTPTILASIAMSKSQGFKVDDIIEWKRSKGTTGVRELKEKIIILRKREL